MTDFVQHPVVQALAWALMHFLWQGAAIGLVVLIAARVVRSASARYAIGVGALAAMLAAFIATFLIVYAGAAVRIDLAIVPANVVASADSPVRLSAGSEAAVEASSSPTFRVSPDVLAVAVMGWIAGVVFFSIRLLGGWVVARRLARNAVRPASEAMQALACELCDRLQVRRAVRILESSALSVPVMVGWIRPAIVLPMAALASLTPAQVEALLAHELAHVRRHDYLVNLLQSLTEAVLFYHPAVWWLSRRVRADRELCCDDLAVGVCDRLVYATALTDLATLASPGVALAATDGNLLGRIRRILGQTDETAAIRAGVMPALALVLVVGAAVSVALASTVSKSGPASDVIVPGAQQAMPVSMVVEADDARSVGGASAVEQTPAQQAERQRQIEEVRRKLEELQKELARLEQDRGTLVASAEVRDRQARAEQQQIAALARQAEIEKMMEKVRQGANADQLKALAAVQQDMAKMRAEQTDRDELKRKSVEAQERSRALEVMAAKQSYEDLRRQFEKGLITQQQLSEAEAALKRVEAQGNPEALAQVDRAAAERQLQRTRTLFEKGLMTERQVQEAELALQRAGTAGDPLTEITARYSEAQAQYARQLALFEKGLVTQQQVDQAKRQLMFVEQQLKAAQVKASVDQSPEKVATDARALYAQLQAVQNRGYATNPFAEAGVERAPNQDEPVKSGDILRIAITGEPDLPTTYHVSGDGTIRLPFLGAIKVAGLKASEVRAAVGKQLSDRKLGSASQVAVTLMRAR